MKNEKYRIREICGDWALDIPFPGSVVTIFFNSRANAELVKQILIHEDARPGEAVPFKPSHFPDLTKMAPITLEQLRRMECPTPVWAEVEGKTIEGWDSYWCLCHRGRVLAPGHIMMYADSVDGVAFYAYPPAHIDRDAWTAEWKDHYKSGVHAGTGAICSSCDVWNERKTHICPLCGKAMDEDGFAMLEKRMGVR